MKTEIEAKSIDEAITNALLELGTTSDNIDYVVLQEGKEGFFGIGSKPYLISAWRKDDPNAKSYLTEANSKKNNVEVEDAVPEKKNENALSREELTKLAREYVYNIGLNLGLSIDVDVSYNDKVMLVNISGDQKGLLIGKKGAVLDNLQYLISLVVNKYSNEAIKVRADVENYRLKREAQIRETAKTAGEKVLATKKPNSLDPMNPYERRIVHSELQNYEHLTTKSEGKEPYRHVVISYKE